MFSISQNSLDKPAKTTKINTLEQIEEFNNQFNTTLNSWKNPQGYYTFYGLDRGSDEMATLCRVSFDPSNSKTDGNYKNTYQFEFKPFEFYRLREYLEGETEKKLTVMDNLELIQILKNPSQWMTDYQSRIDIFYKYFELTTSSCLDMTRAKLIKNKITNKNVILELGDIMTYQKFAILNAKNKYGAMAKLGKSTNKLTFDQTKQVITLQDNTGYNQKLYYHKPNITTEKLEYIQQELQTYIDNYSKITFEEAESLFRYKKALAGNMIGILDHLYQEEKGFIVLENLDERQLDKQTKNSTSNHRQLERSLYQKWQGHCTVPPKVNMPSMWQELSGQKTKPIQLGNILLIDESGTSKNCPVCGVKNGEYNFDKKNEKSLRIKNLNLVDQKWIQHRFGCVGLNTGNCGFDTGSTKVMPNIIPVLKGLNGLTTSDDVASYNIAKRGLELIIGNTSLKTKPTQTLKVENNNKNRNKETF